ncbi:hypothetical protein [Paraburkholderia dipogonis]|uniref:hypothetical protein n=1 Tax=Paraburkholderia dipogonis TaxID=1211383 RepID=UPI0038B92554
MNRSTVNALRALALLIIVVLGIVTIVSVLTGCTLVYIEGDSNSVTDTGGHGGGLTIPPRQDDPLRERLNGLTHEH